MSNLNFDNLKDKVCVLTGGAGVIGSSIAKEKIITEMGEVSMLINGAGGNSAKATTQIEKLDKDNLEAGRIFLWPRYFRLRFCF